MQSNSLLLANSIMEFQGDTVRTDGDAHQVGTMEAEQNTTLSNGFDDGTSEGNTESDFSTSEPSYSTDSWSCYWSPREGLRSRHRDLFRQLQSRVLEFRLVCQEG